MKTNSYVRQIEKADLFNDKIKSETLKNKPEEKGYSKVLNDYGVVAYYNLMVNGIPLNEQSFPELSGLEIDPKDTISFKDGLARGIRLASVGNLEEVAQSIEAKYNNKKTR